jgi:hypothetical protein
VTEAAGAFANTRRSECVRPFDARAGTANRCGHYVTGRPLGQLIILLAQVVRRAGRPERVQRLRGARANERGSCTARRAGSCPCWRTGTPSSRAPRPRTSRGPGTPQPPGTLRMLLERLDKRGLPDSRLARHQDQPAVPGPAGRRPASPRRHTRPACAKRRSLQQLHDVNFPAPHQGCARSRAPGKAPAAAGPRPGHSIPAQAGGEQTSRRGDGCRGRPGRAVSRCGRSGLLRPVGAGAPGQAGQPARPGRFSLKPPISGGQWIRLTVGSHRR